MEVKSVAVTELHQIVIHPHSYTRHPSLLLHVIQLNKATIFFLLHVEHERASMLTLCYRIILMMGCYLLFQGQCRFIKCIAGIASIIS